MISVEKAGDRKHEVGKRQLFFKVNESVKMFSTERAQGRMRRKVMQKAGY